MRTALPSGSRIGRFLRITAASAVVVGGVLPAAPDAPAQERAVERLKARFARSASVVFPAGNPYSVAKAGLGRRLFHERALSRTGKLACAGCHRPDLGFADGLPFGTGVAGVRLPRHTPSLWNLAEAPALFWDGHAASLEEQAVGPIVNPIEMGLPMREAVARLNARGDYRALFADAFPNAPAVSERNIVAALATYERTLVSPETRFDRWVAGDRGALSREEARGFALFTGKAGCANCHDGWAFTDHAFHDIGLAGDGDRGRGVVLGLAAVDHAFKTPGLRELARTAPYMHDGRFATLEEVVRHYERGVVRRSTLSDDLPRVGLWRRERRALLAFLGTLTADVPTPAPLALAPATAALRDPTAATVRRRGAITRRRAEPLTGD